jgi:hypothetical protein
VTWARVVTAPTHGYLTGPPPALPMASGLSFIRALASWRLSPSLRPTPWPSRVWRAVGGRCGGVGGCGRPPLWLPERAISTKDSQPGWASHRCPARCLLVPALHAAQFTPGSRTTLRTRPPRLLTDWWWHGVEKSLAGDGFRALGSLISHRGDRGAACHREPKSGVENPGRTPTDRAAGFYRAEGWGREGYPIYA